MCNNCQLNNLEGNKAGSRELNKTDAHSTQECLTWCFNQNAPTCEIVNLAALSNTYDNQLRCVAKFITFDEAAHENKILRSNLNVLSMWAY